MHPTLTAVARLAVTAALAAVPWALERIPLPGASPLPDGIDPTHGATLGLLPVWTGLAGVLVVELVAAAVPRLRARRHGDRRARRPLTLVAGALGAAVALAFVGLTVVATSSAGFIEPGLGSQLAAALGLAVGVVAPLAAAAGIARFGVGPGLAVVLVVASAGEWVSQNLVPPTVRGGPHGGLLTMMLDERPPAAWLVALAAVALTWVATRTARGRPRRPLVGLEPIVLTTWGIGLGFMVASLAVAPDLGALDLGADLAALRWPVLVPLALAVTLVVALAHAPAPTPGRRAVAGLAAVGLVAALFALDLAPGQPTPVLFALAAPSLLPVVAGAALAFDLAAELRARVALRGAVVAWTFRDVARADRVSARLHDQGVAHALAGGRLAALFGISMPWATVRLLVRQDEREAAEQAARAEEARPLVAAAVTALS